MDASLADLSLRDSVARLRERSIALVDLLEACLARIEATRELGAFVDIDPDAVRREARRPQPSPLHGVPVAIKDIVDVAGLRTRAGTRALDEVTAAESDAAIVAGLRARGAIPIGKVATHELADGVTTPAVRNPRAPERTAGGSSGGSAVAVAAGTVPLALGTDTAGSVRIPAACCGICGLIGRNRDLPTGGVIALSESLDTLGVLVREPEDLSLAWQALSGRPPQPRSVSRVLVCRDDALGRVDDAELAAAAAAVERLALPVRPVAVEPLRNWGPPRSAVIAEESLAAHRALGLYPPADPDRAISTELVEDHAQAERRPPSEVAAARRRLAELGMALHAAVEPGSVLVLPALPGPPPLRTVPNAEVVGRLTRLVAPMNIARLACAVVPVGGIGVQLAAHDEDTVLAAVARLGG